MGAYAQCAERLIERGFAAVPIMPGTKRPGFFFAGMWIGLANWQRCFNGGPPPPTERERWATGDTGVGVVAGQASHGLIAVDIDSEDPTIQATLRTVLPPTHVRKTGARGETLFYHGPDVATLDAGEWREFLRRLFVGYELALRRKILNNESPF